MTPVRTTFHPFLPNGPGGDPVVWIDVQDEGHSLLFDLGDLTGVSHRKLLRVDTVMVSHTHMDHFVGFDRLLRLALRREEPLVLTGPAGFLHNVSSKLGGYTWNLIDQYPLRLRVQEIIGGEMREASCDARRGDLAPVPLPSRPFDGLVREGELYSIHAASFDHGIPVLGYALREHEHLAVDKDRLGREGLRPGPWLRRLKTAVRENRPSDEELEVSGCDGSIRTLPTGGLAERILRRVPGQSLAYLTDLSSSDANLRRAASLARDVQLLICETPFLQRDERLARERHHLTARQAGELARVAGARKLAPFHFSPRYEGSHEELLEEAAAAFGGPLVRLPAC
jgi:ribonuclease Z